VKETVLLLGCFCIRDMHFYVAWFDLHYFAAQCVHGALKIQALANFPFKIRVEDFVFFALNSAETRQLVLRLQRINKRCKVYANSYVRMTL
jgi:hypothetical protein